MVFEIVILEFVELVIIHELVLNRKWSDDFTKILDGIEILQQGIEIAGVSKLIETAWPIRTCRDDNCTS